MMAQRAGLVAVAMHLLGLDDVYVSPNLGGVFLSFDQLDHLTHALECHHDEPPAGPDD